jgi:hypothetical protein
MEETSGSLPISTQLERIAGLARRLRDRPLTTLAHHINLEWLREAHRTDAQRWRSGRGRTERGRVRGALGGQPSIAARTRKDRHVPGAAGPQVHIPKGSGSETSRADRRKSGCTAERTGRFVGSNVTTALHASCETHGFRVARLGLLRVRLRFVCDTLGDPLSARAPRGSRVPRRLGSTLLKPALLKPASNRNKGIRWNLRTSRQ